MNQVVGSYNGSLIRATAGSAGYDIVAVIDEAVIVLPGQRKLINTGVTLNLNPGYWAKIHSRSGLSVRGIDVGAGVIDEDYHKEIKVLIINNGTIPFIISNGDRIAQLVIGRYFLIESTDKKIINDGLHEGFGSTDHLNDVV